MDSIHRCELCGNEVCIWEQFEPEAWHILDLYVSDGTLATGDELFRRRLRNKMYVQAAHWYFDGPLGYRKELPKCIVSGIRWLLPSPRGKYVGFKKSKNAKK